jgi:hypothetical protein
MTLENLAFAISNNLKWSKKIDKETQDYVKNEILLDGYDSYEDA